MPEKMEYENNEKGIAKMSPILCFNRKLIATEKKALRRRAKQKQSGRVIPNEMKDKVSKNRKDSCMLEGTCVPWDRPPIMCCTSG